MKLFTWILDNIFPQKEWAIRLKRMSASEARGVLPLSSHNNLSLHCVFQYRHPLTRELIRQLKYRGNKNIARMCGEILWDVVKKHAYKNIDGRVHKNGENIVLIPIPITIKRRRIRGFNQNELVIDEILRSATSFGGDCCNKKYATNNNAVCCVKKISASYTTLIKTRDTIPQSKLKNKSQRLTNLSDCFSVVELDKIRGKHIVLIDDVMTTGSTLKEARRALTRAGARSIFCITIAH